MADKAVRTDKWLWAVRLCRTRSAAGRACSAGHVRIGGNPVKPSRLLRPGDVVEFARPRRIRHPGQLLREEGNGYEWICVTVKAVLEHRVSASQVDGFLEWLDREDADRTAIRSITAGTSPSAR